MSRKCIYLIGALRNPRIPEIANALEKATGYEVFADWYSAGPDADDFLRDYAKNRNPEAGVKAALQTHSARNIFAFDKGHIDRSDAAVLVMPCGRSGHLELGYVVGQGKPGFVLFDAEPERIDVMYQFATGLAMSLEELVPMLNGAVGAASAINLDVSQLCPNANFGGRPRSY